MKPSPISVVMLVVSLFLAPALSAQSRDSANQNAASSAQPASAAEVPRLIKFSGTLLDAQDRPLAGPVGVTFALHAQQTGGAALWIETQNVTPDAHGNYTVLLGANSTNGVPAELFASGEARWLEVQVERQAEQPRVLLVSVPYALKAKDAETLGGRPASAFLTTETLAGAGTSAGTSTTAAAAALPSPKPHTTPKKTSSAPQPAVACTSVTSDGTAAVNSIALFTAPCAVQSSVITQSGGNVGMGTAAPAVALDIVGNNAGMRLSGTGTHQVTVTGASSGRLGQDFTGFFFSSDTNGKVIKFLTNNGALNEWMRITSAGNVGIGTTAPGAKLDVAGTGNFSGTVSGSQLVSTATTGTPPLSVTSISQVPNLNASMLGGLTPAAFATIANGNIFGASQTINSAGTALTVNGTGASSIGLQASSNDANGIGAVISNSAAGEILSARDNTGNELLSVFPAGVQLKRSLINVPNDTTTGTVLNELAKFTSAAGGSFRVTSAGDAGGAVGIVVSGAGIAPSVPNALVTTIGDGNCVFDNTAIEADYIQISPTAAGQCHDSGATYPTSGQVLGRVTDTSKTPPQVYLFGGTEVRGAPPVYSVSGVLQSVHVVTGTVILSGGTATVTLTGAAAFTSNLTYNCVANTGVLGSTPNVAPVGVAYVSGTSFVLSSTAPTPAVPFVCFGN
jgi:hypothetical protein